VETRRVSIALVQRLGHEATNGLLDLLQREKNDWSEQLLNVAVERFERRLTEEVSGLRIDMVRELRTAHVEMFKWSFLFWIGQVAVMVGVLGFVLRRGL
jgi:hypothetical protein